MPILSDNELRHRIDEFGFHFEDSTHSFDIDHQVQAASIDLRIDNVFWKFKSSRRLSLDPSDPSTSKRQMWERIVVPSGEYIDIRPNGMILARTLEKFNMPNDCAGQIEGRSSYARLGLEVTLTGGFINPGFSGHKALQIKNNNTMTIRIFPYLPMCQLVVMNLTSKAALPYSARERNSKYLHGEGGPSYWWKDAMFERLKKSMMDVSIHAAVQEKVLNKIGEEDPLVIHRLTKFVGGLRVRDATNADHIVHQFCRNERKLRRINRIRVNGVRVLLGLFLGTLVRNVSTGAQGVSFWVLACVTLSLSIVAVLDWFKDTPRFFTENERDEKDKP